MAPQKYFWEGINLNKISKKIVSLVTTAAFVTTLVPAAAFGATIGTDQATVDLVGGETQTVYLNSNGEATATFNATIKDGWSGLTDPQLGLWVGDENGATVKDAQAETATYSFANTETGIEGDYSTDWNNSWWTQNTLTVGKTYPITGTFTEEGDYPVWSGIYVNDTKDYSDVNAQYVGTVKVVKTDAVADGSRLLIDGKTATASATQGVERTFSFNVVDAAGNITKLPFADTTYVWVEDPNGVVVKDAFFGKADGSDLTVDNLGNGIYQVIGQVNNKDTLNVTFPDAGDGYSIHAVVDTTAPTPDAYGKVAEKAYTVIDPITVNVTKAAVNTSIIEVTSVDGQTVTPDADLDYYTVRIDDEVTPSNTKEYTVTGYAWVAKDTDPAEEVEVTITPEDAGMTIVGDTTVKTDNTGKFTFKYKVDDAASYIVKLVAGDATSYLKVTHGDVDAVSIEKIADGGYVLAGTDKDYADQVFVKDTASFADAVQLAITDAYGRDAVGEGVLADEAAANKDMTGRDHSDAVSVEKQPEDTVDADNFYLAWDEDAGVYTLEYQGDPEDLIPGDYEVRIALNNGGKNAVTVAFTAAEFGDVEELVLDMSAADKKWWDTTNQNNAITAIDDQVALGQWVKVVPKYVDANGLKVKANAAKMQVGINGDAVIARDVHGSTIGFATAANTAANSSLVGSTITVKVNDASIGAIGYVEKELTVVKNYLAETVSIDPTSGVVGEPNTVTVSVVDEDGNLSKVNGTLTATIVGQSDEEATVDLKVNQQVKNGTARMYLESDKAGTADVRVVVEAANGELYADTFTYTFGSEDPYAGRTVVMTIGSSDYLINNAVVEGDAAPYVDDAWRTMVPFRVLGEAFGAEVDWNQEAQSVTYTVGDTEIVMTIGENTYTLNGEEQTMDTAPVLSGDRTYVPVRFVAEDLGFEVTPLYDVENGATASVVFQK